MKAEVTEERRCYFVNFEDEGRDHKPRNVAKL